MAVISLERPQRSTVVRSFAGHLEAAPDAAFRALAEHFAPIVGAAGSSDTGWALIDEASRTIVVQGSWWYRGEYRVLPEPSGALVEHEIVNVAPRWHRAGPLAGRRVIREAPGAFQALLTGIA